MLLHWLRQRRWARLRAQPVPADWTTWIQRHARHIATLPAAQQHRLLGDIAIFLAEKRFEAGGGFTLTDEIKVTIAAQACRMLLGFDPAHGVFPRVRTIVVHATGYRAWQVADGRLVDTHVLGHTDLHGPVDLAWNSVRHGGYNPTDGRNLVYHEFAHKLDLRDGIADGTPDLPGADLKTWADVMTAAYNTLCDRAADGRRTLLDHYGATNPAEFFAVASEVFFEKPRQLQRRHRDLYHVMARYYRQDPAAAD